MTFTGTLTLTDGTSVDVVSGLTEANTRAALDDVLAGIITPHVWNEDWSAVLYESDDDVMITFGFVAADTYSVDLYSSVEYARCINDGATLHGCR